jgi:creatinine amidohydrolase
VSGRAQESGGDAALTRPADADLPRLADARWPQVERAARDLLVVPLGSLEQHGPHLPLDTDAFLAAAVAARVHAGRPGAGLTPVLPLGSSGEHAGFAGTLSIGTEALTLLLVELVRDADRDWRAVLVVNGHGGNLDAVRAAQTRCREEGRRLDVVQVSLPGMDAHAGRAETSMMLHLAPDRVALAALEPFESLEGLEADARQPLAALLPRLRRDGVRSVSASGVLGDPRGASAEEGKRLLDGVVARALVAYDACLTDLTGDPFGAGGAKAAVRSAAGHPVDDPGRR